MLKRITAWVLMVALLTSAMPVQALAEKQYQKSFVVLPLSNIDERPFRQWAAKLVKAYKEEYTKGWRSDGIKEFSKGSYSFYEKKWSGWELYEEVFDECLYHPYYTLAEKKYEYNVSKDANGQYNGETIKETEFTLMNEQDLKGLYMWIIKETIQEKAEADPNLFLQKVEGNDRLYSFSVKDGVMVRDSQLHTLEDKTVANAWNDVGQFAVSALEVAIESAYAWNKLNENAANFVDDAVTKANQTSGEKFMDVFLNTLKDKVVDSAIDLLCDSLSDILDTVNKNFNASMNNIMRTQMTSELLNTMLDCNSNIVAYLKSTYVENENNLVVSSGESGQAFSATVEAVIDVLESAEFQTAIQNKAEITVTDEVYQTMLDQAGIKIEDVLSDDEMWGMIGYNILDNLLKCVISMLKGLFTAAIEAGKEVLEDSKAESRMSRIFTELLDAVNVILGELEKRGDEVVSDVIDELSNNVNGRAAKNNVGDTISKALKKHFSEGTNQEEPFVDQMMDTLMEAMISSVFAVFGYQKQEGSDDPKTAMNQLQTTLTRIATGTKPGNDVSFYAVLLGNLAFAFAKGFLEECQICLNQIKGKVSVDKLNDLNTAIKSLEKVVMTLENAITSYEIASTKSPDEMMIEGVKSVCLAVVNLMDAAYSLNEAEWNCVWESLEGLNWQNNILTTVKKILKSKNILNMILKVAFGGSVQATAKAIVKKAGAVIDDGVKKDLEGLMKTVNAKIEDTVEIVTDLWDTMMDCSADLAKASNSVMQNLAGEHSASLVAERARQIYIQSNVLESANLLYTEGGRAKAYFSHGDYESFLNTFVVGENNNVRYLMNEEDILYHDLEYRWVLTPQLNDVKTLTDYIMTQMNLDAVGMGAYLTVLDGRDKFPDSTLYSKYLNKGVLMEEKEALNRYNRIVEMIDRFEGSRPDE